MQYQGKAPNQGTHMQIDRTLVGEVLSIEPGHSATVELPLTSVMAADARGLVHGGFTFGLADYAAMVAVNDPYVVLGAATAKFLKPSEVGQVLVAKAKVKGREGKKSSVVVEVFSQDQVKVFEGEFTCFSLPAHVLGE